jgi:hypothetical protein
MNGHVENVNHNIAAQNLFGDCFSQKSYRHFGLKVLRIAKIYAGLGNKDQAFAWIEKDFRNEAVFLRHKETITG